MDLKTLSELLTILSATPALLVAIFVYFFFEFRMLKRDVSTMKKALHNIQNNGFVHKTVYDVEKEKSEVIHDSMSARLDILEDKIL